MTHDNTPARRAALVRKWKALNASIETARKRMASDSVRKGDVVRELRAMGLTMAEVAETLGVSRQAAYDALGASVAEKAG